MIKNKNKVIVSGQNLKIEEIATIINNRGAIVSVSDSAIKLINSCKFFLDNNIKGKIVYGINTGFGPMASMAIGDKQLTELQKNLIRSHATGIGEPIKEEYVLAAMIIRLNMLSKGYSGVSSRLVLRLRDFINHRIIPVVPEHGAVGTSGDLVQLAHIALALIGEGEVFYNGERKKTVDVLKKLKIGKYELEPKEGLALINGTAIMSGIMAVNCIHAKKILDLEIRTGGLALEMVRAFDDSFSEVLHLLRPHEGQIYVAKTLRSLLFSSKLLRNRENYHNNEKIEEGGVCKMSECIQEVYSFRCISQILGPIYETILKTWKTVEIEINSVTDNPVIDWKNKKFLHGGNFHGDYISYAADQIKISLVKLTMLSERRTNFFLHEAINKMFPPFLNINKPGLTLGLQGLQFVATSTTSQSQTLAFPQYVHSIPTNADNQDVVSMGTDSALLASKVIENAYSVLSIECVVLSQVVDILKNKNLMSSSSKDIFNFVRKFVPVVFEDRVISSEIKDLISSLKKY
ncbi:MAG: Histidine ammonia-lyase [Parcubacteria group bacterium GW2011_GWF2_38_76]|nr:MAG: Histidine ammonia-lyase [Parcubacteria group bacterium GW2011_GWF2_38_76]HBM45711.1 histidine ammonia-lyase [Patescibacteria group bacterium]